MKGDITVETTEGIVNAANTHLRHGAGVAGAILRGGGNGIQEESDRWVRLHGPVSHDRPAWTSGGNLKARVVIHAVGLVWGEGQEENRLAAAVSGSLRVADEQGLQSVALPALSTGIFGFPLKAAADIILTTICGYFKTQSSNIGLVRLVLHDEPAVHAFRSAWQAAFGGESPETKG